MIEEEEDWWFEEDDDTQKLLAEIVTPAIALADLHNKTVEDVLIYVIWRWRGLVGVD